MQVVVCVECPGGALMKHFQPVADTELKLLSVFIDALMQKIVTLTQQLFGASSQDGVSASVGRFHSRSSFFGTLEAVFHHQPPSQLSVMLFSALLISTSHPLLRSCTDLFCIAT